MASHWHLFPLRVRYEETDRMDVVFHANYATWFEIGRTEFIRHAGRPYRQVEDAGLLLPVVDLNIRFERPARYDDRVVICTRLREVSPFRLSFDSQVRLIGETEEPPETAAAEEDLPGVLLAAGGTGHVWLNRDWKPARIDRTAPELYALLRRLAGAV
jgi:acyl-CoA thioester hydrolase